MRRMTKGVRDFSRDPYLKALDGIGTAICQTCGIVYFRKKWFPNDSVLKGEGVDLSGIAKIVCPACRREAEKDPGGIVILEGDFLKAHREEIMNLIRNEEERAKGKNPIERIMGMEENDSGITIYTTDESLAHSIGNKLEKTYGGKCEINWSKGVNVTRVRWSRELPVGKGSKGVGL